MKKKEKVVPHVRNKFVVAALFRQAGAHKKTNKATRRRLKQTAINLSN